MAMSAHDVDALVDAYFQRGTPATLFFSTTDHWPLEMEARQKLERTIRMACCRAMQLDIRNADRHPGTVSVQVMLMELEGLVQPRIEPEICFKLKAAPRSSQPDELLACLEWLAHSVEIVQCRQPGWKGVTVAARLPNENVLGSPLLALAHLVELLRKQPGAPPLAAGEFITTGTLTDAHPVARGETWTTQIRGLPLHGLKVSFA